MIGPALNSKKTLPTSTPGNNSTFIYTVEKKQFPEQKSFCINISLAMAFSISMFYIGYLDTMFNMFGKGFVIRNYVHDDKHKISILIGNISTSESIGAILGFLVVAVVAKNIGLVKTLILGEF